MRIKLPLLVFLTCVLLFAQKPSSEQIDHCGLGTHHNCQCSVRYHAIQQKIIQYCELHSQTSEQRDTCMQTIPFYCNVIDRFTGWDEFSGDSVSEDGEPNQNASTMGPLCTGACKKHDCSCFDGPTCHIGHQASDHAPPKKKK